MRNILKLKLYTLFCFGYISNKNETVLDVAMFFTWVIFYNFFVIFFKHMYIIVVPTWKDIFNTVY